MRSKFFALIILTAISLSFIFGGCGGGGGTSAEDGASDTIEASAIVDSEGGVIEVTDPQSSLYGVKLTIPQGALDSEVLISISIPSNNPPTPRGYSAGNNPIKLSPSGLIFSKFIKLNIPSDEFAERNYYTYVSDDQVWTLLPTTYTNDSFEITLSHFSIINSLCRPVAGLKDCRYFKTCTTVKYWIDATTSNAPGYTADQIKKAIKNAVNTWQEALGTKLNFVESEDPNADIIFFWSSDGFLFQTNPLFSTEALGTINILRLGTTKIKFNDTGNIVWSADNTDLCPKYSIEAVALHEIGHALGLAHYDCPGNDDKCRGCIEGPVMAPSSSCSLPCIFLEASDIDKIGELYHERCKVVYKLPIPESIRPYVESGLEYIQDSLWVAVNRFAPEVKVYEIDPDNGSIRRSYFQNHYDPASSNVKSLASIYGDLLYNSVYPYGPIYVVDIYDDPIETGDLIQAPANWIHDMSYRWEPSGRTSLWAITGQGAQSMVYKFDPFDGTIAAEFGVTLPILNDSPQGLAYDGNHLWITKSGTYYQIDPDIAIRDGHTGNAVLQQFDLSVAGALAIDYQGYLWTHDGTHFYKIDVSE